MPSQKDGMVSPATVTGRVVRVTGPVVDAEFPGGQLPSIFNALTVELSLGEVAERVGRSKPSVSNRVRLLELPEDVLWMLARGDLTEGHARAVLALPDDDARRRLARRIANCS